MMAFACWLTQLIGTVVQIFYAWRTWSLAVNKFLSAGAVIITLLALSRGLSAITRALEILGFGSHYNDPSSILIQQALHTEFSIWSSGGLLPDTLIAICMVYFMFQPEPHPSFQNKSVTPIVAMAQIGAFPVICAFLDLVLVIYFPSTNYHFVPAHILGKLFVLHLGSHPSTHTRLQVHKQLSFDP
ncbi:hypothetical protein B0H19DRAFT_1158007 [Mycena capillaripes]|nr:hypothetical protein B0H19DRAFT_1158007 [Mycena capillaripes]